MMVPLDRGCPSLARAALLVSLGLLLCLFLGAPLLADEGMWLFNDLPLERLKEKYGFTPPPGWSERLMRAAVRLSSGGSGAFVSGEGLVLTNHHVGSDCLQKMSTPQKNLLATGFVARTRQEEARCPDLEVISLAQIEDVTARVNGAVAPEADFASANKARREAMATIEKESKDATGLQSEVVVLYGGGAYHLYRYRRYDDVRLVMAPETDIAFFGGDRDNFEFPRYDLDICFFRVYREGKPARIEDHLSLEPAGLEDKELTFVAGHPGRTQRLFTADHLRFLRDLEYPTFLANLYRREIALQQFSLRGEEEERIARDDLFSVQNSRKALRGLQSGLLDPAMLLEKLRAEADLRGKAARDPALGAAQEDWSRISEARSAFKEFYREYQLLEAGRGFWSRLNGIARTLVRLAEEKEKPNQERLPGFRESDMETLELELYSTAPIYPELEKTTLRDSLTALSTSLGAEHPLTRIVLGGRSPDDRASEVVSGTRLSEVQVRRETAAGGSKAIRESKDPMIALARSVDPYARAARKRFEDLVQGVEREAYAHISKARFAAQGTRAYPDATFTLRLAYGVVKGYLDEGRPVPPFTTLGGAFEKYDQFQGKDPYRLPKSWLEARSRLDLSTPFNFVSTADIIGGNSGSPVVNRAGNQVGIIFDGNIQSLVLDIYYTEEKARAIAVASPAILEALRKIYGAEGLAAELTGKKS
jgi:hypothetical protein